MRRSSSSDEREDGARREGVRDGVGLAEGVFKTRSRRRRRSVEATTSTKVPNEVGSCRQPERYGTWKWQQHDAWTLKKIVLRRKFHRRGKYTKCGWTCCPKRRVRRSLPLKKRCINGAYTEDRARWEEELKGHSAKIYDDPEEVEGTPERENQRQRREGGRESEPEAICKGTRPRA